MIDPTDDYPYNGTMEEVQAYTDRKNVEYIIESRLRPTGGGCPLKLAEAFQALDILAPDDAARVAETYMRSAVCDAAYCVHLLIGGYSIRPLAVLALESRADVRALILGDPEGSGALERDDLEEARTICRAIDARLAAEEALAIIRTSDNPG